MDPVIEKYFGEILKVYQKEVLPADNRFDLFGALNESLNEEAFIYRCGYYVVNKCCNKNLNLRVKDTFYTIYLNALLKFDVMEFAEIQFFEVYKMRDLTSAQIHMIKRQINNIEDVRKDYVKKIMNMEFVCL